MIDLRSTTTGEDEDADTREVQRLQQVIRDHRATLDVTKAGTPAYQPALTAVLEATVQLINHEVGTQMRRREAYSTHTAKIVRRIGLTTATITAVVAVLTITPWLSKWWLLLLVPLLTFAILLAVTATSAAPSNHSTRRTTTIIWALTVGADLVLVILLHWLPHWIIGVLMFMATLGCLVTAGQLLADASATEPNETNS